LLFDRLDLVLDLFLHLHDCSFVLADEISGFLLVFVGIFGLDYNFFFLKDVTKEEESFIFLVEMG